MTYPILDECTKTADGNYRHTCGELLDGKRVHHPIWVHGLGPCAGTGEVVVEVVPFCKRCGPEPSAYGTPIYNDGVL